MASLFKMSCRWCGVIFKHDCVVGYCSDACKQAAKAYHSELRDDGRMVTVREACSIHREEENIVPHYPDEPYGTADEMVLAPVKITAAATQWKYIPVGLVDESVIIITGGRP